MRRLHSKEDSLIKEMLEDLNQHDTTVTEYFDYLLMDKQFKIPGNVSGSSYSLELMANITNVHNGVHTIDELIPCIFYRVTSESDGHIQSELCYPFTDIGWVAARDKYESLVSEL